MDVAIVVPLFAPPDSTIANLRCMAEQAAVIAVDDGSAPGFKPVIERIGASEGIRVVENKTNLGIAAALNVGINLAFAGGADAVVTFDQDSFPSSDFVDQLLRCCQSFENCGVMGPGMVAGRNILGSRGENSTAPREVQRVIQSGMLIPKRTWEVVGQFDEALFIDMVDTDYCFRVRRHGLRVLADPQVSMVSHQYGAEGRSRRLALGPFFSPSVSFHGVDRRYYMNRNWVRMAARHLTHEPATVLRTTAWVAWGNVMAVTLEDSRLAKLRAIMQGLVHGFRGRGGRRPRGRSAQAPS